MRNAFRRRLAYVGVAGTLIGAALGGSPVAADSEVSTFAPTRRAPTVDVSKVGESQEFAGRQASMRRDLGLPDDKATIAAGWREAISDTSTIRVRGSGEIGTVRVGLYLSSAEAAAFDKYGNDSVAISQSMPFVLAEIGDIATSVRVNHNVLNPEVTIGVVSDEKRVLAVLNEVVPSGWTVRTWEAEYPYNVVKRAFDQVVPNELERKLAEALRPVGIDALRVEWSEAVDYLDVVATKDRKSVV